MNDPPAGADDPDGRREIPAAELAAYLAQMSGELALLAGRARWPLLAYLLNLARAEAEKRMFALDEAAARTARPSARRSRGP